MLTLFSNSFEMGSPSVVGLSLLLCVVIVNSGPSFHRAEKVGTLSSSLIREASGLCASRQHSNVLYTHNDSGDTHRIYAISATSGDRLAVINIDGAKSNDWEDIACGPCPGGSGHCIYIGDTGGNTRDAANIIYRIREPDRIHDQHVKVESTLMFSWDQDNAETVMVDPNGEVYVVSKVEGGHHAKFVRLPSSAWGTHHRISTNDGVYLKITTNKRDPVGGDISPAGNELLLKTHENVYYWYIPDRNYYAHIREDPQTLPYHHERQGESVCWDRHGNGYYTVSEGSHAPIYYYKRTSSIPSVVG